jgi:hypothetical protein
VGVPIKLLLTSLSAVLFLLKLQVSGVVFTVACEPYLESEYGNDWVGEAPIKLLDKLSEMPGQAGEEVVVVGQVLADEATLGYEDVNNMRVSVLLC